MSHCDLSVHLALKCNWCNTSVECSGEGNWSPGTTMLWLRLSMVLFSSPIKYRTHIYFLSFALFQMTYLFSIILLSSMYFKAMIAFGLSIESYPFKKSKILYKGTTPIHNKFCEHKFLHGGAKIIANSISWLVDEKIARCKIFHSQ